MQINKTGFGKVLAKVFEDEVPESEKEKKDFLTAHRIALWDVIASCEIIAHLIASIRMLRLAMFL